MSRSIHAHNYRARRLYPNACKYQRNRKPSRHEAASSSRSRSPPPLYHGIARNGTHCQSTNVEFKIKIKVRTGDDIMQLLQDLDRQPEKPRRLKDDIQITQSKSPPTLHCSMALVSLEGGGNLILSIHQPGPKSPGLSPSPSTDQRLVRLLHCLSPNAMLAARTFRDCIYARPIQYTSEQQSSRKGL